MGRVIIDIRDERGRFVTRLHPDERTYRLWQAAALVKGMTIEEFVRTALSEYLANHAPVAPEGVGPKPPKTCPGCKHEDPDEHQERHGEAWCIADMTAAALAGEDPRSVGPCY